MRIIAEKKLLAIIFFSTAKHFIIKRNKFTNNPFLSANEKEQNNKIAVLVHLKNCFF